MEQNKFFSYIRNMTACIFSDSELAKLHAKRNAALQISVATIAFILLVRVFPMGLVQNHAISDQKAYHAAEQDALTGDIFTSNDKKLQTIYFTKEHIYQIRLYMSCVTDKDAKGAEAILFRLYNDAFSCIYEEDIDSRKIEKNGFLTAQPDMDVESGKEYYYEILIPEQSPAVYALPVADRNLLAQPENSTLYIDGIINEEVSLIADFDYSWPLSMAEIALYDALILIMAFIIYAGFAILMQLYDEWLLPYSEHIKRCIRFGIVVLVIAASVFLWIYSVVFNKFGGEIWDRIMFTIGIAVSDAWIIGFLGYRRGVARFREQSQMTAGDIIGVVWRNYIQIMSFGLLFYALCQYVNADREFYHNTNTRWMLIFLAIAFLMNYNRKLIINKINLLWLLLGTVGAFFYCHAAGTDENALILARLTSGVVVAWGLFAITAIINILCYGTRYKNFNIIRIRENIIKNRQQSVFIGLWVIFCIFMVVYRYEKIWVFTATLPFLALFFIKSTPAFKSRFLRNFSNGIFVSFALVTLFCLLHRPHHYWMLYRYGGIFHTVACTGMYLAVVFGTAMAKLYGKLKDRNRKNVLVRCCFEYFVTAAAAGFILLTISRTVLLTTAFTVLTVVILTAVTYHKGMKRVLSELGVLGAVCLLSFPMVFTAVRMAPAVVNDPVRYELEFQDRSFMVYEGDPLDSDKYMTVRRFFSVFLGRFQKQEEGQAQNAELTLQEKGTLAYTGYDLAGLDMQMVYDESDDEPDERMDISNGRFDIFRDYIKAIGIKGHPKMGPENENGEEYAHAHNSYLQVAYNFGMIAGVLFLILYAMTLWKAIRLYIRHGSRYGILLVPFALVVVFGFISLTEWAFHPCIPAGFSFILMQVLLMKK